MKLRSDFREHLQIYTRHHRESGEERPEPILLYQNQRWHSKFSSSSSSWWQWNEHWWSSKAHEMNSLKGQGDMVSNAHSSRTQSGIFDDLLNL